MTTNKPEIRKSEQEIKMEIEKILRDERIHYPPADVFLNAPLALIQVDLGSKLAALCWVLGINPSEEVKRAKAQYFPPEPLNSPQIRRLT